MPKRKPVSVSAWALVKDDQFVMAGNEFLIVDIEPMAKRYCEEPGERVVRVEIREIRK